MKITLSKYSLLVLLFLSHGLTAIPNCYVFEEGTNCYKACKEAEKALKYGQGRKASQQHFLKSAELCPEFAFTYFEMAVPFAKRGQMNLWIDMIDKAVALEPESYLAQRGWYHWFFMHNYEKAIADIDRLDMMVSYDIGETGDGLYHLDVLKALCYKGLGQYLKAIALIENRMAAENYYTGAYDHLHLGVLYLETDQPEKALEEFEKQKEFNNISEAYFYAARAYEKTGSMAQVRDQYNLALEKYDARMAMHNPYRQLPDKIYRIEIEESLRELKDAE